MSSCKDNFLITDFQSLSLFLISMIKRTYNVIGVMSGTSLDGIDLAFISFTKEEQWQFKIITAATFPYSSEWFKRLKNLTQITRTELAVTDNDYTHYLASVINQFITDNQLINIDAVCSHGHTALHQPDKGYTIQIGNLSELASLVNQTVVCDFRVQDVDLGGQGAPLVPIGDQLLFSDYDWCLNLGGFANISTQYNSKRVAFDICAVNIVLNKYVEKLGLNFDDKGVIARQGCFNSSLFEKLNELSFFKQAPPKSLGLEWVEKEVFPLINSFNLSVADVLHTFIKHISYQISTILNTSNNSTVLVTGGGVFNVFLIEEIDKLTLNQLIKPSSKIIDFKEALIFGFLGVLKLRGENNCLSTVTGAKKDHSSGVIFQPKKT